MNRRAFLAWTLGAAVFPPTNAQTKHLIFIVNGGGVRKKDYYEDELLSPNIRRLAGEGFTFEEDHCEGISSHDAAFMELLTGRESQAGARLYPTVFHYLNAPVRIVGSLRFLPAVMERYKPAILVCRETAHDLGHQSYAQYRRVVQSTDSQVGRLLNWVKNHPCFGCNTAIVLRPEFGRDDEVNRSGQLHHSQGFYYTHRVASIFWGPDFNKGVDRKTVISRLDMAPTIAAVFGVRAAYAQGQPAPGLLKMESLASGPIFRG